MGLPVLKLGASTYLGKSQSTLFNGLNKNDHSAVAMADSSVVGISMIGFDARYRKNGF